MRGFWDLGFVVCGFLVVGLGLGLGLDLDLDMGMGMGMAFVDLWIIGEVVWLPVGFWRLDVAG